MDPLHAINAVREVLARDPLTTSTRTARRSLLVVSLIAITVAMTGLVPTKISALGIEFSPMNRPGFFAVIELVLLYYLITFLFYALHDLAAARVRFNAAFDDADKATDGRLPLPLHRPFAVKLRIAFDLCLPIIIGLAALILLELRV